jgi:hypothetical protein
VSPALHSKDCFLTEPEQVPEQGVWTCVLCAVSDPANERFVRRVCAICASKRHLLGLSTSSQLSPLQQIANWSRRLLVSQTTWKEEVRKPGAHAEQSDPAQGSRYDARGGLPTPLAPSLDGMLWMRPNIPQNPGMYGAMLAWRTYQGTVGQPYTTSWSDSDSWAVHSLRWLTKPSHFDGPHRTQGHRSQPVTLLDPRSTPHFSHSLSSLLTCSFSPLSTHNKLRT